MRPAKLRRLLALTASGAILAGTCTGWAARADTVTGEGVFMPRGSTAKQFGGAFCPCVTVSSMPTSVRSQSAKLDAAVMASAGPTVVVAFSLSAVAADDMVADWIADPATAPDPQRVWIVTTGNPLNRYGGTQRDRAAAIPAVQPYRHLDVVNQYDSVADRPARWGWYSQRELSLSRHLAYDEVDINAPENLVYRDGNTTYMLVPAKELRQLRGLRFLRDIGWVTPERYDELDAERRTRIEADYDRPAYIEQGPGADWGNGVEPEVLREQEIDDAELRSVDDAVQDDAATAEQVVDDSPRRNGVPSEPDPDSLDSDLQLADDGPGEGDDSEASDSDDARGGEAGVRERVDSGVEAAGDGDQDTPGDTSDSADSEGGGGDE
ncbi:MAG: hypothetical protein CMH38_03375 [Microbacterium sp.]|uniref:PE-PPE domain-containing protein n=1 Tax=Microbacterium sp. TaxID=51671 RepID=UPI000C5F2B19|nr:PE-PPE domain-containing protein [Microbacterium sp.]MAY48879.1 hypothetical protein [Microbacterium sp.]MAY48960.1 hypothetical protein [Microbacterium sp.]